MANNLEDLNRQLEEAQRKAVDADKQYSSIREELSKIGENYYKTTMLTIKEQENVTKKYKELHQTLNKEVERRNVLNKALDEETKVEKQKVEKAKQEVTEIQKKIEEAKKPRGINAFLDRIGYKEPTGDDLALQRRARSRIEGISNLVSGNFGAAFRDLTSSVPKLANLVRTGWFAALQLGVQALLKFDNALAKSSATASSITGGLQSQYVGKGLASMAYNTNLKNDLYNIGMQGQRDELISALQKNYGYASYQGNQREFINTMAYGQKGLSSYGIEGGSVNQLISNLRLIEGKNQQGVYAQLQRLTDRFNKMAIMSPEQALQQATSLYDQTKHLGTNFEWASRAIQRFEVGLKNGTISLNDFAAVNRALRGGGVSKNAGIAAMVTDYASRAGINLPSEFLNSNAIGQGFGISTRGMLRNNKFAQAYQGTIQEQLDQMGGATKLEKAGMLQYLLGQYGVNISPEMAENAIKSNGQIDLLGTNIIGTGAYVREKEEKAQADKYQSLVESYYKGTTSWHTQMLTKVDKLIANTGSTIAEGAAGNIDPDATGWKAFGQALGYSLSTGIWEGFGELFTDIGKRADKMPIS